MDAATLTEQLCPECQEPTVVVPGAGGRDMRLEADEHFGGLYRLSESGRPVRRSLVAMYLAQRDHRGERGRDVHVCAPARRADTGA